MLAIPFIEFIEFDAVIKTTTLLFYDEFSLGNKFENTFKSC